MPALPDVDAVIRVRYKFSRGTDIDVLPRAYFSYGGTPPTSAQLVTMATALETTFASQVSNMCTSDVTGTEIELTDLSSSTAATGSYSFSAAGARSGGKLPASACALVNFTIDRRYRGGKPRIYLPFGAETDLTNAQDWGSSFITAVNTSWGDLVAAWTTNVWSGGGTLQQVNVSYYEGFASVQNPVTKRWRNIPTPRSSVTPDDIVGFGCNTRVGSQRRRLGKG